MINIIVYCFKIQKKKKLDYISSTLLVLNKKIKLIMFFESSSHCGDYGEVE